LKKTILLFYFCTLSLQFQNTFAQPADVLDLLPAHARSILGFQSPQPKTLSYGYQGPNCFMGVMYWYNPSAPIQFVNTEEIKTWIQNEFRSLSKDETPKFGDVVVFARPDTSEDDWRHAAIFLEPNLVWNKLGPDRLIYDYNTDKDEFKQPAWTISLIDDLQDLYSSEVWYFRKK
jgi:hypothetical protein